MTFLAQDLKKSETFQPYSPQIKTFLPEVDEQSKCSSSSDLHCWLDAQSSNSVSYSSSKSSVYSDPDIDWDDRLSSIAESVNRNLNNSTRGWNNMDFESGDENPRSTGMSHRDILTATRFDPLNQTTDSFKSANKTYMFQNGKLDLDCFDIPAVHKKFPSIHSLMDNRKLKKIR